MGRGDRTMLCYALIELLSQGKSEPAQKITDAARSGNIIQYLMHRFKDLSSLSQCIDVSDLNNEISQYDFSIEPENYGISSFENGLVLLLTLLVQDLA